MEAKDCLRILREIKDVAFATVDDQGLPQIRMIDVMLVESDKLYFCTSRGKDFYHQLQSHPHVAITGMNKDYQMIRLSGEAYQLDDAKKWIDLIFEHNPTMNDVYPGKSRYVLEPFCIAQGEVEFFDLGVQPIERQTFVIGSKKKKRKGFMISEKCIGCNQCKIQCPQQCIEVGKPYVIQQNHCLHCGLCYEKCPVQAIRREEHE